MVHWPGCRDNLSAQTRLTVKWNPHLQGTDVDKASIPSSRKSCHYNFSWDTKKTASWKGGKSSFCISYHLQHSLRLQAAEMKQGEVAQWRPQHFTDLKIATHFPTRLGYLSVLVPQLLPRPVLALARWQQHSQAASLLPWSQQHGGAVTLGTAALCHKVPLTLMRAQAFASDFSFLTKLLFEGLAASLAGNHELKHN